MNYVDYRFGLDIHEIGSQVFLTVKQGANAQRLRIHLTEAQSPYIIEDGCIAVFAATKSDGNVIFNNCTVEGNEVVYEFTDQTVAALGTMPCEIRLYSGSQLLVSARFTMSVVPTAVQDADIESITEVNTLTSLIGEAAQLIADVQLSLDNGEFIPKISVGTVETLPAGSNATVEVTGTGDAPVFNFGIPQGEQGQAESLIPDTELSLASTKPVQNKVITQRFIDDAEAVEKALEDKVDKVTGKGLSANDFTDIAKNKLAGIETGANKYSLPVGGTSIGGVKNGGDIEIDADGNMDIGAGTVGAEKIANNAVSESVSVTLAANAWANNQQTVTASNVTASNTVIVAPSPESFADYSENGICCTAQASGSLTFICESVPTSAITVNVVAINK